MNRSPEDAFPTTIDDLQGFWDMVYLQVTHVDSIFADIEQLKANDWIVSHGPPSIPSLLFYLCQLFIINNCLFILQRINEPPKPDTAPQKTTSTRTTKTGNLKTKSIPAAAGGAVGGAASGKAAAASSAAALKREAQRKLLMEMKRQRREALAAAAKNQTACDGDGAAGEDVKVASTNNNAEVDVAVATVASATIGDTVNIAVKNSS